MKGSMSYETVLQRREDIIQAVSFKPWFHYFCKETRHSIFSTLYDFYFLPWLSIFLTTLLNFFHNQDIFICYDLKNSWQLNSVGKNVQLAI